MNVRFDSPFGSGDESLSAPIVIAGFKSGGGSGSNHLNGNNCQHYGNGYSGGGANEISGPNTVTPETPSNFDPTNYSATCNLTNPSVTGPTPTASCPLPRDPSQAGTNHMPIVTTNNAAWSQIEIGNGPNSADLQAYWNNHHGTSTLPAGVHDRWDMYQCELGVGSFAGVLGCSPTWNTDGVEPHGPACTNSTPGDFTRRVINVAIVDCNYYGITGHSTPIPPTNLYAQFFMTEPALDDGSIYAEYIGCFSNPLAPSVGCTGTNNPTIKNGINPIVQLVR
jgi:hypothetical protein